MVLLQFSVNASGKGSAKGPMVRDGGKAHNAAPKVVFVRGIPRVCLFATKTIEVGEEVLIEYGSHVIWGHAKVSITILVYIGLHSQNSMNLLYLNQIQKEIP